MRLMTIRGLVFGVLALFWANAFAVETQVTVLTFSEKDSSQEAPYISRVILNADYMRMDDGKDDGDFALLDRKSGAIYSVSHDEQRTLVISLQAVTVASPKPLRHDVEMLDANDVPDVGGKKVSRFYLFTNGTRCMEIYAVPGFLEDVRLALGAFARTLAGQHAKSIAIMPDQITSGCDLANNIYEPDRYLSKGFPVRQIDFNGRSRALISIKENVMLDSVIFDLPEGYERFMPGVFSK